MLLVAVADSHAVFSHWQMSKRLSTCSDSMRAITVAAMTLSMQPDSEAEEQNYDSDHNSGSGDDEEAKHEPGSYDSEDSVDMKHESHTAIPASTAHSLH